MGLEDWDWRDNVQGTLTSDKYYSPPYSLTIPGAFTDFYCKAEGTLYIPNGRVEFAHLYPYDTWFPEPPESLTHVFFRVVLPPGGTTPPSKYYSIGIDPPAKVVALGYTEHDMYWDIFGQLDPTEFNFYRVTWWSVEGVGLVVRCEVKIDNEWYKICDDFIDPGDRYKEEQYNRVGFRLSRGRCIDDIRIYKAI